MSGNVLITGAAARIGSYIAKGLAADGWTVVIHYNRSETAAIALAQEINDQGGQKHTIGANLAIPSDRDTLIQRACDLIHGPLTVLINNASTFRDDAPSGFSRGGYDHHMDINLYAPLKLSQDFAAQLPDSQSGAIINMIDQWVLNSNPTFYTYGLSKSALYAATKSMAQDFAPNIRVNGIGPGPTLQNTMQSAEDFAAEQASTLLGAGSPPETIVAGVKYLLGADAVTGQMIAIDGGQHLNWKGQS